MGLSERFGDNFIWGIKYRPNTIDEILLPERLKSLFNKIIDTEDIPNMLFYGEAGVGKTTIAIMLSNVLKRDVLYINGSSETGVDIIRNKITNFVVAKGIFGNGKKKIVICDEYDGSSHQNQNAIKSFLEEFSKAASFIFITNHKNKIIEPLQSRLQSIEFNLLSDEISSLKKQFFKRSLEILKEECVPHNNKVVAHIVNSFFPDMRKCLNELQKHSIQDSLENINIIRSFNMNIEEYFNVLKKRNFYDMIKYVVNITDPSSFYSKVFDSYLNYVDEDSIPDLIFATNKYSYESNFVVPVRINLTAYSLELMNNVKFK